MPWYENESILPFDPYVSDNSYGWYFFTSAPGLNGFSVKAKGDAKVIEKGEIGVKPKDCAIIPEV